MAILIIGIAFFITYFLILYIRHIYNTIHRARENNFNYGWATIITFKVLYKKTAKNFIEQNNFTNGPCRNYNDYIDYKNVFRFNCIYMLLDPISFVLIKIFCRFKRIAFFLKKSDFFKTYSEHESKKVMEELIKER